MLFALLFFIAGLFSFNTAFDIHLHDTYYIIPLYYLIWTPALLLFLFWLLYLSTKNILFSKKLSWTHIIFTIVACIMMVAFPYFITNSFQGLAGMPRRYHDTGQSNTYGFSGNLSNVAILFAVILVAGQVIYLLNFFIGLYRRLNN